MALTVPFDGGFETGNSNQWDAVQQNFGLNEVVASYSGYVPLRGNWMAHGRIGPGGSTRAEWAKLYNYHDFDGQTRYITLGYLFPDDGSWANFDKVVNPGQQPISICQLLARNLQGASMHLVLYPKNADGQADYSVRLSASGGFTTPGQTPSAEHYVIVDESAGNGWNTLVTPGTFRAAERRPQINGPIVFGTQTSRLITLGKWQCWIIACRGATDTANGFQTIYHRTIDESNFTTAFDTSGAANWKTVQWNAPAWSQPAHPPPEGINNVFRVGFYCDGGVQTNYHFLMDCFTIQTTLAAAQAVFPAGALTPPETPAASGWAVVTGGGVGV